METGAKYFKVKTQITQEFSCIISAESESEALAGLKKMISNNTIEPTLTRHTKSSSTYSHRDKFCIGDTVVHPKFGDGDVLNIEGTGPSSRIQIQFDSKSDAIWLVLKYAQLRHAFHESPIVSD